MADDGMTKLQVVGIDGSDNSMQALLWATARTDQLGDIEPVAAWRYPWWALVPTATGTLAPPTNTEFETITELMATRMLENVDSSSIGDVLLVHGAAGPALVAAAERASLVVVGSRGRNTVASGVLGSVSAHCVHHATVPVAVIPTSAPTQDRFQRVVVGIDGSKHGVAALEWAIDNTPASSEIEAVHVWDSAVVSAETAALTADLLRDGSERLIAETIETVGKEAQRSGRNMQGRSEQGDPRSVLRRAAEGADLLIVGARGRGVLENLLIGSVTTSLVHQPATPTVVVR